MTTTLELMEEFPDVLKRNSKRTERSDVEDVVATIEKIRGQNPSVYDEKRVSEYLKKRAEVLENLVENYFIAAVSSQFPLLDETLFSLKRHLTIEYDGKKCKLTRDSPDKVEQKANERGKLPIVQTIEIPLFVYTPLFTNNPQVELGNVVVGYYEDGSSRERANLTAKLPGAIGPNLKEAYRGAMSHYFATLSEMFSNPVAADIMYNGGKTIYPEIGAIWIPFLESIDAKVQNIPRPQKRDPAMILTARGKRYLVQTWKVDDEEPFEKYLIEFSSGDLKGKVKL